VSDSSRAPLVDDPLEHRRHLPISHVLVRISQPSQDSCRDLSHFQRSFSWTKKGKSSKEEEKESKKSGERTW
jgi:hypothetical protein